MELLLQLLVNGFAFGTMISLLALGFSLVFGVTKIFHVAHGAVYVLAAYLIYIFWFTLGLNFIVSILLVAFFSAIAGMGIEIGVYRPIRRRGGTQFVVMIASFGLLIVMQNIIAMIFGTEIKSLHREAVTQGISVGAVTVDTLHIKMIATALILYIALELFLRKTRFGKAILAVADNPVRALSVGIKVEDVYILTFVAGSALAVIPAIFMPLDRCLHPYLGFEGILYAFIGMIVGGLGSYKGAAIGGLFVGIVMNLAIWKLPSEWGEAVAFGILFIFIIIRPLGFFGKELS